MDIDDALCDAQDALFEGRLDEAASGCRAILAEMPTEFGAHQLLHAILTQQGKWKEAVAMCEAWADACGESSQLLDSWVSAALQAGDKRAAVAAYLRCAGESSAANDLTLARARAGAAELGRGECASVVVGGDEEAAATLAAVREIRAALDAARDARAAGEGSGVSDGSGGAGGSGGDRDAEEAESAAVDAELERNRAAVDAEDLERAQAYNTWSVFRCGLRTAEASALLSELLAAAVDRDRGVSEKEGADSRAATAARDNAGFLCGLCAAAAKSADDIVRSVERVAGGSLAEATDKASGDGNVELARLMAAWIATTDDEAKRSTLVEEAKAVWGATHLVRHAVLGRMSEGSAVASGT